MGDVKFIKTTSDQLENLPVVDGQLIVLTDTAGCFYDQNSTRFPVSSSGSGGHIIKDADGTSLTQRAALQFGEYMTVSDDSVGDATLVSAAPTTVTWSAYQQKSTAEKLGTLWQITDYPDTTSSIGISTLKNQTLSFSNLTAEVAVTGMTANTHVLVFYSVSSIAYAEAAGITAESTTDKVVFTAETAPTSTVTCDIIYWDDTQGGSPSGGGGHIIMDSTGTELSQENVLQFKGGLSVTDDSTNGKTVVDDTPEEIEWDDWIAMTPQEQEAIENGIIINAPGADGNIKADLIKVLWSNLSPSTAFASGTIDLGTNDYDFLLMVYKPLKNSTYYCTAIIDARPFLLTAFDSSKNESYRQVICDGSSTLTVNGGFYNGNSDNDACIPLYVYGFKKTIDVDFSAIASGVSTSASKCMLSDGVTSVGDVIDKGSVSVTADGVKTYTQLLNSLYELADFSKLSQYSYLVRSTSDGNHLCYNMISYYTTVAYFTRSFVGTSVVVDSLTVGSSSSWKRATTTTSTTITDNSSGVAGNGEAIILYY